MVLPGAAWRASTPWRRNCRFAWYACPRFRPAIGVAGLHMGPRACHWSGAGNRCEPVFLGSSPVIFTRGGLAGEYPVAEKPQTMRRAMFRCFHENSVFGFSPFTAWSAIRSTVVSTRCKILTWRPPPVGVSTGGVLRGSSTLGFLRHDRDRTYLVGGIRQPHVDPRFRHLPPVGSVRPMERVSVPPEAGSQIASPGGL